MTLLSCNIGLIPYFPNLKELNLSMTGGKILGICKYDSILKSLVLIDCYEVTNYPKKINYIHIEDCTHIKNYILEPLRSKNIYHIANSSLCGNKYISNYYLMC